MTKEQIKQYMKEHKISYRKLAKAIYISPTYLHEILNGKKPIHNYGIKIEKILKGDDTNDR